MTHEEDFLNHLAEAGRIWNDLKHKHKFVWEAIQDHVVNRDPLVELTMKIGLFRKLYPILPKEYNVATELGIDVKG